VWSRFKKIAFAILGLAVFILALELLKTSARGLAPLFTALSVDSVLNTLGMGWLMAYIVLSGSPVAAVSLTLFSAGIITDIQSFAMITGSRLGASFIVLLVGFISYLRGHQRVASISIGVLAFLVTATIYLPAMGLGYVALANGWFDRVQFGSPQALSSFIEVLYDPIVHAITSVLPGWMVFILGIGVLLLAFNIFDRALPEMTSESTGIRRVADFVYRPSVMFALGMLVTTVTLSVSVSLGILVPLSVRGYVRRENLIPYVMGANITTFIDTLFAALLLNTPRAFTIVFVEMASVAVLSLLVLLLTYSRYRRVIEWAMESIVHDNRRLVFFLIVLLVVPIILLLL
jgi:Na+/phosphate symporter